MGALTLGLALLAAWPHPLRLAAQESPEDRVVGAVDVELGFTRLAGRTGGMLGLGAGIWLGPWFVGGHGTSVPGSLTLAGSGADPSRLHFGYGGLRLGVRLRRTVGFDWIFDVLAGAGRARLRDPVVSRELGADNFLAAEPRVHVRRGFFVDRLHLGVAAGFRQVWGVEDLPGLDGADFRGPTLSLSLSLDRR